MIRHIVGITAIALLVGLSMVSTANAQETTLVPIPAATCSIDPITYQRLSQIIAEPIASPVSAPAAQASPIPGLLPSGTPADDATTKAIQERLLVLTACINSGDLLRTLDLYSDGFVSVAFQGQVVTQAAYVAELGKTSPRPAGSEVVLYGFSEVVIAPDGRAVISVLGDDLSSPRAASYTLFYFINEGGAWRIDASYDVGGDQTTG